MASLDKLTPQQVYTALKSGQTPDGEKLSASDINFLNSLFTKELSDKKIDPNASFFEFDSFGDFGDSFKSSSKSSSDIKMVSSTSTESNKVGDAIYTKTTTTTLVDSSDDFYASDESVKQKAHDLAEASKSQKTAESEKAQNGGFYKDATKIVAGAKAPEITEDLVYPDLKGYNDGYNPTDPENSKNCDIGVVRNYLTNSSDPEVAALAQKAQSGDVAATRELTVRIASWQKPQIENAQKIEQMIADGKSYDDAHKAGVADNYGFPIMPGDQSIVVPSKYLSVKDKTVVDEGKKSIPEPPPQPRPDNGHETMPVKMSFSKAYQPTGTTTLYYNPSPEQEQYVKPDGTPDKEAFEKAQKTKAWVEMLSVKDDVDYYTEDSSKTGAATRQGNLGAEYHARTFIVDGNSLKTLADKNGQVSVSALKEAQAQGKFTNLKIPETLADTDTFDIGECSEAAGKASIVLGSETTDGNHKTGWSEDSSKWPLTREQVQSKVDSATIQDAPWSGRVGTSMGWKYVGTSSQHTPESRPDLTIKSFYNLTGTKPTVEYLAKEYRADLGKEPTQEQMDNWQKIIDSLK